VPRHQKVWLAFALVGLMPAIMPVFATAQDDPNDRPLGDVARTLRKESASKNVIDNDNLTEVMQQAESRHVAGPALKFLMAGESKDFRIESPDATCSLSFHANTKSLLSDQYAQMELPASDMLKLSGPATVEGDALTVSVFNGTDWHVSEIAVAFTVVKKGERAEGLGEKAEVRPEKKPDVTVIYKMRAAASPSTMTVFSAPINLDLSGDEWHWAIVQARGYPPRGYAANYEQEAAKTGQPAIDAPPPAAPAVPPSLLLPQGEPAAALSQNPR
jgi:hypothetical protein